MTRFEPEAAMIEGERAIMFAFALFGGAPLDRTTRHRNPEPVHAPCACCGPVCRHCTYARHDHADAGDCPRRLTLPGIEDA